MTRTFNENLEAVRKIAPQKTEVDDSSEMYIQVEKLLKTQNKEKYDEDDVKKLTEKLKKMKYTPQQISEILNRTGKLERLANVEDKDDQSEMPIPGLPLDSELKKHAHELQRIQSIVKQHRKENLLVLTEQSSYPVETPAKVKYEDFINEVLSGQSIMDINTLEKNLTKTTVKKFAKSDIEDIKKQRTEIIARRSESAFLDDFFETNKSIAEKLEQDRVLSGEDFLKGEPTEYELLEPVANRESASPLKELNHKRALDFAKKYNMSTEMSMRMFREDYFKKKEMEEDNAQRDLAMQRLKRRREIKKLIEFMKKNDFEEKDYDNPDQNFVSTKDQSKNSMIKMLGIESLANQINESQQAAETENPLKLKEKVEESREPAQLTVPNELEDEAEDPDFPQEFKNLDLSNAETTNNNVATGSENDEKKETVKQQKPEKIKMYDQYRLHTLQNLTRYLTEFFFSQTAKVQTWSKGHFLKFDEIFIGESVRNVYIFWEFMDLTKANISTQKELKEEIEKITASLNKYSSVLGGHICRDLGFRRAPTIKFAKSVAEENLNKLVQGLDTKISKEAEEDLMKNNPAQYEHLKKTGKLQEHLGIKAMEMKNKIIGNLDVHVSNRPMLNELAKQVTGKTKEKGPKKRERNNRNPDGSRKKYVREDRSEKLWRDVMQQ